jgi:diadenosine tetraphosphate (Ap4A) HIT family hydrolase
MIKNKTNPYFVIELETGYVVIGDFQHFKGYTLFLCKEHVSELHFLPKEFRDKFLGEMALVAEAVYNVFQPEKLNYELLGNGDSHVHWHLFPRVENDTPKRGPVWWLPPEEMWDESKRPGSDELNRMVLLLKEEIIRLSYSRTRLI